MTQAFVEQPWHHAQLRDEFGVEVGDMAYSDSVDMDAKPLRHCVRLVNTHGLKTISEQNPQAVKGWRSLGIVSEIVYIPNSYYRIVHIDVNYWQVLV